MELEKAMLRYAQEYRYEEAARLRDQIRQLRGSLLG
jgi:excinuclease UvrABC helicase subunit UvrB